MSKPQRETWAGYVIDLACVRKAPSADLLERAAVHTTECALMGHCVESGFALIDDDGRVHLLEPAATTHVVRELLRTGVGEGLRLQAVRELDGSEMRTVEIRPVHGRDIDSAAPSPATT